MVDKASEKKEETKREKFVRIAQSRTEKALSAIANLGGLTAKTNYEYTQEDWEKIFSALTAEMNKVGEKVKSGGATASQGGFTL